MKKQLLGALGLLVLFALVTAAQSLPTCKEVPEEDKPAGAPAKPTGKPLIWKDPGAVEKLDLVGGPLGRQAAPKAPFTFVEESFSGTNPKIKVRDANKVQWTMKFGSEVNAEVFASRLAWAVGYFVEPSYFVTSGTVTGTTCKPTRTKSDQFDPASGQFWNARFERQKEKGVKKLEDKESWAYAENPFVGKPELAGLKVMMMLVSNWDNKDVRDAGRGSNTSIFQYPTEARYLVTDWGGSMGKWGGVLSREKWDCRGFASQTSDFVKEVKGGEIRFGFSGQHKTGFQSGIKTAEVKWLMQYLGKIADTQISDALKASGATAEEVTCFTSTLRDRIRQLNAAAQQ
jgi:hypothetical protein